MKQLMILAAAILCVSGSVFAYSGGDGSTTKPYQISNVADFQQLSNTSTDWGKAFILTSDINLNGLTFAHAPIAPDTDNTDWSFQGTPFRGSFDGNGYTISNLTVYSKYYSGLFGYVGGQIRNLGVENINVGGAEYVGGLVGYIGGGTLTSCYATGTVAGSVDLIGGLVGWNNSGTLTTCYATSSVNGYWYAGGLVGLNEGSLTSCYATGAVTGTDGIGGLVGLNGRSVTSCYATSLVTGGSVFVGGLIGENRDPYGASHLACFWDKQTSGQIKGVGGGSVTKQEGAVGKSTAEMKMLSTFTSAGWDFQSTWYMPENSYPILAWQVPEPASLLLLGVGGVMIRKR